MTVARSRRRRFLIALGTLWIVAFAVGATATPPDAVTQLVVTGPLLVLSVPLAWLVVTRTDLLA